MTGTGPSKQWSSLKWLLGILLAPALACATDDHIRLDKYQSTVNIDWKGHVTGNDPINVYISRNNGGAGCTRVSNSVVLVERPPLSCSNQFNATNSCFGGGLHEPIAIGGVWTQAHVPTTLCNVNESDVWIYSGNNKLPQPAHFYPFSNVDSNPDINTNLDLYNSNAVQGDAKILLDPISFCDQMGRPGSYTHDYVVRMMWDATWGGTGFFQGIVNAINEVPTESGFDMSWTNDNNHGEMDTQYTGTINCLAPPAPTMTFTLVPNSVNVTVYSSSNISVNPWPMMYANYQDLTCTKGMQYGAFFSKETLFVPGSPPDHASTILIGNQSLTGNASSTTGCTSQTQMRLEPDVTAQAQVLCKDAANSGKTLVRTQSLTAQLCATGQCTTLGSANISANAALTVNVICPEVISDPVTNKTPVGLGQPVAVGAAPASVQSQNSSGGSLPAAATNTPSVSGQTAPKPADEIDIPTTKPKP